MIGGKYPVSVPDVFHALATCHSGMRPVPVSDGSAEMRAAPVVVVLHDNGLILELPPSSWVLVPHIAAKSDDEKGPAGPEQLARLVFHVRLPPGYALAAPRSLDELTPADVESVSGAGTEAVARVIPEHAHIDPAVFAVNYDAINAGIRATFDKGKPQQPTTKDD